MNKIIIWIKKYWEFIKFVFYVCLIIFAGIVSLKLFSVNKYLNLINKKQKEYTDKLKQLKKEEDKIEKNKRNRNNNISNRNKKLGI